MTGATAERRSPLAAEHDPPVDRFDWTVASACTGHEILDETVRRAGWSEEDRERLGRHAGIHLDGHRLHPERPRRLVAPGTRVVAYRFHREPRPVELSADAVLLDRGGLVAVAKPPWLTVQGTRASRLCSLELILRERLGCPRLTPIHRLDRETSGVVLFARNRQAASELGRQFQGRTIEKEYLAVVAPEPASPSWTVEGELVRVPHSSHSRFGLSAQPVDGGRHSRSRFEVLETFGARALVRCLPETGRTHQLRVHLEASGCPIAGDSLYGVGWAPGHPGSAPRLQLHALSLRIRLGGEALEIGAAAPSDFGLNA